MNILSRELKADPFPFYARLREEAPVYRARLPDGRGCYLVTRYADVAAVLRDERFVKDRRSVLSAEQRKREPWMPAILRPFERNMLDLDPPDHRRLRSLVQQVFTPRRIEGMRAQVQSMADRLLDAVEARGRMELVRSYALPLPLTVIAELLGVPPKDHVRFHRVSKRMLQATTNVRMLLALPHVIGFVRYLRKFVAMKRAEPADDLLSALIAAEEEGSRLDEDELLAMIVLLLIAGHETTVNLIASGTLALLEHPAELERLRAEPSRIGTAVEELLRYTAPVETATERFAREDVTLDGVRIARGELVLAVLASANRDAAVFEQPDRLDITREPNRHLAFGLGIHYCLGAALARLEGQIAIETLVRRLPALRLAGDASALRWRPTLVVRGLEALPVRFD